jgi:SAM-dependent methyltransferase
MTEPHASWASIYDLVYEQSFGEFYSALTDVTIEQIITTVQPPARIVDFGAGTGRLAIPLSACGFEVVAVEPSKGMLEQLRTKPGSSEVTCFTGKMQDFETDTLFDMAVCVFTVLIYLLDEDSLRSSLKSAYWALHPGGNLLIDIPSKGIFNNFQSTTDLVQRKVTVKPSHDDVYLYEENTAVTREGETTHYDDQFQIRYWNAEQVLQILSDLGFFVHKELSTEFAGTGSRYFLMQK